MDIRKLFFDFFQERGHTLVPSSPLVPDDPTLMFTNAGMVQFKNIFTGEAPVPTPPRAISSQTCLRAGGKHNDLDNVGYTARHHTLFEMLGNFSFSDYFKEDAISYAWEFITSDKYLNLPVERLWVTVHESDDEAEEIWKRHISAERIMKFGDKDNFWQMGDVGPCGPCSEIFYDQGGEHFGSADDIMGGEGDRFLEIWNLVFMQYERDQNGTLVSLPKPSIDTGMGLERVTAIKEGVLNNYHSSLFMPFLDNIGELVGKPYKYDSPNSVSYRVIADHLRSVSFLLAQGMNFDKEGRGYVLRRIMRRAIRHGYLLGLKEPFMYKLVDTIVDTMGSQYSYLAERSESIKISMKMEEERFFDTIEAGIKLFNQELAKTKDIFSGEVAFKLYDTYGFPLDLTEDMLRAKGVKLAIEEFDIQMKRQKEQSKASWKGTGDAIATGDFKLLKEQFGENKFVGYDQQETSTKILALLDENFQQIDSLKGIGWVMLEQTPFYAQSGGQVGDRGKLIVSNVALEIDVLDTQKFLGINLSKVNTGDMILKIGNEVVTTMHPSRMEIEKHHSATHLLHAALRAVLGEHVTQSGAYNDDKRLRFDFSHPRPMTAQEIERVEKWVNDKILRAVAGKTEVMTPNEAKDSGAIALFGQKYGKEVRVVSFGDVSAELCGGTHVKSTANIGLFVIVKESGVSAGVRRIEAICGRAAIEYLNNSRSELSQIRHELKNSNAMAGIKRFKEEIKRLKQELKTAQSSNAKSITPQKIGRFDIVVEEIDNGDIKEMIDEAKNRYDSIAIMLFQKREDKVLLAAGSKNTPIKAGDWIKVIAPVVGGGGGGRSDFAQAGGKLPQNIPDAMRQSRAYLVEELKE